MLLLLFFFFLLGLITNTFIRRVLKITTIRTHSHLVQSRYSFIHSFNRILILAINEFSLAKNKIFFLIFRVAKIIIIFLAFVFIFVYFGRHKQHTTGTPTQLLQKFMASKLISSICNVFLFLFVVFFLFFFFLFNIKIFLSMNHSPKP